MNMLNKWIDSLPTAFQPWAVKWSWVLMGWTAEALAEWVALLRAGDLAAAEAMIVANLSNDALLAERQSLLDEMAAANAAQVARNSVAHTMLMDFLSIAVALLLPLVGL